MPEYAIRHFAVCESSRCGLMRSSARNLARRTGRAWRVRDTLRDHTGNQGVPRESDSDCR
jgi:hypothetical protein